MSNESLIAGNTPSTDAAPAAAAPAPTPAPAAEGAPAAAVAPEQNVPAAKPADTPADKPAEGAEPAAAEKPGAPEKYEFKAPEGSELNPEVMTKFEGVAKELGLTQEAAQKVVDAMGPQIAAVHAAKFEAVKAEWTESARADKEFGGEKLAENLAVAKKALDAFGTPELRTLLNDTGLGNHPEIIRAFFKAGQKISGPNFVAGGATATGGASTAATLYPKQSKG